MAQRINPIGNEWNPPVASRFGPAPAPPPPAVAVLSIVKAQADAEIETGGEQTYTVIVTNTGTVSAAQTLVFDALPDEFTFASCTIAYTGAATGPVVASAAELAAGLAITAFPVGTSVTLTIIGTFDEAGEFTNTSTAIPPSGSTVEDSVITVVADVCIPPSFVMEANLMSGESGDAPAEWQFTLTEIHGTGPFTFAWDFGDGTGSTSTEQNPAHTYEEPSGTGGYEVSVTITNACGEQTLDVAIDVGAASATCAPEAWEVVAEEILDDGGSTRTANAIAYGEGLDIWVVAGAGLRLVYSTDDGDTWTPCTHDSIRNFNDIHFADGLFVAVGNNGVCYTSTDGINFTSRTSQFNAGTANTAVTWGDGLWIVSATGNGYMFTSADGITWTQNNSIQPFGNFTPPLKMTYGSGVFVAVGDNSVATSANGLAWAVRLDLVSIEIQGIAYNADDDVFIAACWDNVRYISVNGAVSWTSLGSISGRGTQNLNCIEYACGAWVAGWEDGYIDQSEDNGATWPDDFGPFYAAPQDLPIKDFAHRPDTDVWLGTGNSGRVYRGTP